MARITVEDCLQVVPNRFELTLLAAKRARTLAIGNKDPMVDWDNDKPTVVALREIAAGNTDFSEPESDDPEKIAEMAFTNTNSEQHASEIAEELAGELADTDQQEAQLAEGLLSEYDMENTAADSTGADNSETDA